MRRDAGFTLVEVIAALTLMGGVMVATLLALTQHRRQVTLVADRLVAELTARRGGLPESARGRVLGHPTWIWQTAPIGRTSVATVPLRVVRFRILEVTRTGDAPVDLVSVDLITSEAAP
jgi:prepilin-type N-terminal cleavage/methylation domain-containing protein